MEYTTIINRKNVIKEERKRWTNAKRLQSKSVDRSGKKHIRNRKNRALSSDKGTSGEENQPLCEAHIFFRRLKDRQKIPLFKNTCIWNNVHISKWLINNYKKWLCTIFLVKCQIKFNIHNTGGYSVVSSLLLKRNKLQGCKCIEGYLQHGGVNALCVSAYGAQARMSRAGVSLFHLQGTHHRGRLQVH